MGIGHWNNSGLLDYFHGTWICAIFGIDYISCDYRPSDARILHFFLSLSRNQDAKLEQLFGGFSRFGTAFCAYLLQAIFVFLWMLLLIIPAIIAALSYAMTYYIISDNESIGALDAITASKELMRGNKWKLFCLGLRFIGWSLLCLLTFGIGYLWLMPYMATSFAKFYDDIAVRHSVTDSTAVNTDIGNYPPPAEPAV